MKFHNSQVLITSYNKEKNVCHGTLATGDGHVFTSLEIDPFVSCAYKLDDEAYDNGDGALLVGRSYFMRKTTISFHAGKLFIVPDEHDFTEV